MDNLFGLGIRIDYNDRATTGLQRTSTVFNQVWANAKGMTQTLSTNVRLMQDTAIAFASVATAGYALKRTGRWITGALSSATDEAELFQKEMNSLRFVTNGTAEDMELFKKVAIDTGIATQFSPQQATQAMYELKSVGLDNIQMLGALQSTLDMVAVSGGKIDIATGAQSMGAILKQFNLHADESARVSDVVAQITKDTAFKIEEMPTFFRSLGDAPAKVARPMEEWVALAGMQRNLGQLPAQIGQAQKGFMRRIAQLTTQLEQGGIGSLGSRRQKAMAEIGLTVDTLWDAEGKLRALPDIFKAIMEGSAHLTEQEMLTNWNQVFGMQSEAIAHAVRMAQEAYYEYDELGNLIQGTSLDGKIGFEDIMGGLQNASGVAKEGADEVLKTMWGIKVLWEGSKQTFGALMGETVLPLLGRFISFMTESLNVVIRFVNAHPRLARIITLFIGGIGVFLTFAGALLALAGGLGFAYLGFVKVLPVLTSLFTGTGLASLSIAGLTSSLRKMAITMSRFLLPKMLLVGGMYMAWKHDILGVRKVVTDFATNFSDAIKRAVDISKLSLHDFYQQVEELNNQEGFFASITRSALTLQVLFNALGEAWNDNTLSEDTFQKASHLGILPLIENILILKYNLEQLWEGIKEGFTAFRQRVEDVSLGFENMGFSIDPILDKITGFLSIFSEADDEKWRNIGVVIGDLGFAFAVLTGVYAVVKLLATPIIFVVGLFGKMWGAIKVIGAIALKVFTVVGAVLGLPAWAIGLVIAGLVLLGVAIFKYRDQIKQAFTDIGIWVGEKWDGMKNKAQEMTDSTVAFFTGMGTLIKEDFQKVVTWFGEKFDWLLEKFGWATNAVGKVKEWTGVGSRVDMSTVGFIPGSNMASLNTGGMTKQDGIAMLHQNEVILNDEVTTNLRDYLRRAGGSSNYSNDNSVTFEEGAIQVSVANANEQDAEKFAELIMKKIERKQQLRRMAHYQPIHQGV